MASVWTGVSSGPSGPSEPPSLWEHRQVWPPPRRCHYLYLVVTIRGRGGASLPGGLSALQTSGPAIRLDKLIGGSVSGGLGLTVDSTWFEIGGLKNPRYVLHNGDLKGIQPVRL